MSSKKKKSTNPWVTCDICKALILHKDSLIHQEYCTSKRYVNCIIGNTLYVKLECFQRTDPQIKHVPEAMRKEIVLLSENALQLSSIAIGDMVKVSTINRNLVKRAWPCSDKGLLSASLLSEVLESNLIQAGEDIAISKHSKPLVLACEVIIQGVSPVSKENSSNMLTHISKNNINTVLCVGHKICYWHYGQKMLFQVLKITPEEESLEKQADMLSFEEKFCVTTLETIWKFYEVPDRETEDTNLISRIGGIDELVDELKELCALALQTTTTLTGLPTTRGIILFGSHGVGKTMLMKALAQEFSVKAVVITASTIMSKFLGESEKKLKTCFDQARQSSPNMILVDELDVLCARSARSEQEKRLTATLCSLLDELHQSDSHTLVVATTARLNSVDTSLRRTGRFDKEVELPVPTPRQRLLILEKLVSHMKHNCGDLEEIADAAHGFVGADLESVVSKAAVTMFKQQKTVIEKCHLLAAMSQVKPSAMKEIMIEVPSVRWTDIGGQHQLKLKLQQCVEWPLKHADAFKRFGIKPPRGVLMFGPPGCSKTMIAKALATESNLNFLSVKGPELFSKWVGESERAVREVFRRARQAAPSIIFFDELDALGGERSGESGGSNVQERVLAQLLTELDGVEQLGNVTVVGATNRPDRIDPALLRPGRLDRLIYVPLPDQEARLEIFKIQFKKIPVSSDVNIKELVCATEGYSGAEVVAVCAEAALKALEESLESKVVIKEHFKAALNIVIARTSVKLLKIYDRY